MNETKCTVTFQLSENVTQRFPGLCWNMPSIDRCLQSKVITAVSLSRGEHLDQAAYWQHLYSCRDDSLLVPTCCPTLSPAFMEGLVLHLRFSVISTLADAALERAASGLPAGVDIASARLNRTHTNMDVACDADAADACAAFAMTTIRDYVRGFDLDSFVLSRETDADAGIEDVQLYDVSYLCIALAIVVLIAACVYYIRRKHRQSVMQRAYHLLDT